MHEIDLEIDFEPRLDTEYLHERYASVRLPDHDLFLAVILHAFEDLRETVWRRPQLAKEAREWLQGGDADFVAVCHLAGVDPIAIQNIANRYIKYLDAGGRPKRIATHGNEPQGNPPWLVSPHQS